MWTFQAHKLTETLKGVLREGRLALLCWLCPHPTRLKWRFYTFIIIKYDGGFNSQYCPWILGPYHISLQTQVGTSATAASHPRRPRRTRCQLATRTVEDLWTATIMLWVMFDFLQSDLIQNMYDMLLTKVVRLTISQLQLTVTQP